MEEIFEQAQRILGKEVAQRTAYTSFIINEFAETYKMGANGYRYLKAHGGLDYIHDNWWALHIDNQRHVVREIFDFCEENCEKA